MTALLALVRKEVAVLFASPIAYMVLATVALLTAITFFEHLRLYNQILFLYASPTLGGFEYEAIPDHINLRDTVFNPVMEQLSLLLVIPIPLVTMRVFAEERSRGTDEFLLTSGLSSGQIVLAKLVVTYGFVGLMMVVSFIYPLTAIGSGGLGAQHLLSAFIGLLLFSIGVASIGLVCSAFTSSQIVAAASAVAIAFLLYDFGWTHSFIGLEAAEALDAISLHPRFGRFPEGIVNLSDVAYFVGSTFIAGAIVRLSLDLRRLSG